MASAGWSNASAMRKKRRTIGGFRGQTMGEPYENSIETSGISNLGIVPEDQFTSLDGESVCGANHIIVAVRVRPLSDTEVAEGKRSCCDVENGKTVIIRKGADPGAYLRSQKGSMNEYTFDAAFPPEAGQAEVYESTAKPYISEILEGINVTVFAYGATGAGKTHTMMGSERVVGTRSDDGAGEVSGIVPQSLVELFGLLEERMGEAAGSEQGGSVETWSVRVGYLQLDNLQDLPLILQVYNEQLYDLLSPSSKPLKINEDPSKGVVVIAGLVEMEVHSSDEVLHLLRQGNANRRTEATSANQVSSRSHAVLQVVVTRRLLCGKRVEASRESKLSLIDLAGSERASATNNRGEQLRQGANINKSLLSLANCINALAANRRRRGGKAVGNVKYRDSKLTHLLKASLEGNCRLVMIANVNPSHVYFDDSHNTLKYANRAKNIKVDPRTVEAIRVSPGMTEREERLTKEYQVLKERHTLVEAQLEAMRNARGNIAPEPSGFADLFAPNTSSILSVASSTPGERERSVRRVAPTVPPSSLTNLTPNVHSAPASGADGPVTQSSKGKSRLPGGGIARSVVEHRAENVENEAGGADGDEDAVPLQVSRAGMRQGGERRVRMVEEEVIDDGERERSRMRQGGERTVRMVGEEVISDGEREYSSPGSPGDICSTRQGPRRRDSGSATKRKRGAEDDGEHEPLRPLQHRELRKDGDRDDARNAEALAELATARARILDLEGKVQELENSVVRMGEQHDITMELVDTWRHQKETADESLEEERTTVNELLALLKEKEAEVAQLRSQLSERAAGSGTSRALGGGHSTRRGEVLPREPSSTGVVTGDGASTAPVGHMREEQAGSSDSDRDRALPQVLRSKRRTLGTDVVLSDRLASGVMATEDAADSRKGLNSDGMDSLPSRTHTRTRTRGTLESPPAAGTPTSLVVMPLSKTAEEVASAVKSGRKKSSVFSRSKKPKSMIPAPKSGTVKSSAQRRFGDLTNRMELKNEPLGTPPATTVKSRKSRPSCEVVAGDKDWGTAETKLFTNNNISNMSLGSLRRSSSRATPQRVSIAGRTRSKLSMSSAVPGQTSARDVR